MTARKKKAPKPKKVERTLSAALNGDLPDTSCEAICIMALHRFIELGGGRWVPKAYPHGAPPADDDPHMTTEQILEHGGNVPVPHNLTAEVSTGNGVFFEERGRRRTVGSATVAWSHQLLVLAACGACIMHDLAPPTPANCEALARALHKMLSEGGFRRALAQYRDGHERHRLAAAEETFAQPQLKAAGDDNEGMFEAARDMQAERTLADVVTRWSGEAREARADARAALADDALTEDILAAPVMLTDDDEEEAAFVAVERLLLTADREKRGKVQLGGQLRDALRRRIKAMLDGAPPHPLHGIGEWELAFLRSSALS